MIVDKIALSTLLMNLKTVLNYNSNCVAFNSTGEPVGDEILVKLDTVAMGSDVYRMTNLIYNNQNVEPSIEYQVLATQFPSDKPLVLFKHQIVTTANFVNSFIPIYFNSGTEIFVEAHNIIMLNTIDNAMVFGGVEYLEWNSVISENTKNQSVTYSIVNGMPAHLVAWYNKYHQDVNPPC